MKRVKAITLALVGKRGQKQESGKIKREEGRERERGRHSRQKIAAMCRGNYFVQSVWTMSSLSLQLSQKSAVIFCTALFQ